MIDTKNAMLYLVLVAATLAIMLNGGIDIQFAA